MNKLEKLIEVLCPHGVEYKKLGDVATISRGGSFQKKDFTEDGVPCIHYGQIYTRYGLFADKTLTFISDNAARKQKFAVKNDIVMAVTSENIDDVCKCVAWLGEDTIAVSGHTAIIHHTLNPMYLCYYFHTAMFQVQKNKLAHGTKVMEVTPNKLNGIIIPVPPIEIQAEIVRILDNYTKLTADLIAELTAELTARKKQYEYYRDALLNFDAQGVATSDCEWRTLGEIATIVRGASPRPIKSFVTDDKNGINWIKIGDVHPDSKYITNTKERITQDGAKKSRFVHKGDFILSNSMSFGRPYILKIDGCIHDGWLSISEFEAYVSSDYLYRILTSEQIQQEMKKRASFGGAVQNLNSDIVKDIKIPIPKKEEQNRIVSILDRFDKLCNDISEGLRTEIEARRKQYEFYRDKLLSFKEM